jgi:pantothenate synthetase
MCHEQGRPLRDHFHVERVKEAEYLASMTRNELLDDRQRANLLLRVRDELDAADKLPAHSRRQRRQEVIERARHEYGAAFDDEALPGIEAACDEWREPDAAETNALKQLSFQANQRMRGAA